MNNFKIDLVVFSKNRGFQLYWLLETIFSNLSGYNKITVMCNYDQLYLDDLRKVQSFYPLVDFVCESDFRADLINILQKSKSDAIAFFVDDILIRRTLNMSTAFQLMLDSNALCYSLRLGTHLSYCYTLDKPQPIPDGDISNSHFYWNWKHALHDWNYPLSLDGHIFRTRDVINWLSNLPFKNPSTLEASMQQVSATCSSLSEKMVCNVEASIVNIPLNLVQNVYNNRIEDLGIDTLSSLWLVGAKVDLLHLDNYVNVSAHDPNALRIIGPSKK